MWFKHSLLWFLGIVVVTAVVLILGGEEIKGALAQADPFFITALCLVQVGTLAAAAWKWYYLLGKLVRGLSFQKIFTLALAGNFVESVTPSVKFGGEAAKIYLLRRYTSLSYAELAGVLLTHKYVSLFPFVLLAGIFLGLAVLRYDLPLMAYLSFLALGVCFFLVFRLACGKGRAEGQKRKEDYSSQEGDVKNAFRYRLYLARLSYTFRKSSRKALSFINEASQHSSRLTDAGERRALMFLAMLVWVLYPVKVYLVSSMLGFETGIVNAAIITYTAYLVSMLPLFPGGLGSYEGSMAFMFSLTGFSPAEGLAVALLSRLVTYWFPLLLSAVAVGSLVLKQKSFFAGKPRLFAELSER